MSQLCPASQVLSLPSITSMSMGARVRSRVPCPRPWLAQHQEQDAKPAFKTALPTSVERFFLLHGGATSAAAAWLSFSPDADKPGAPLGRLRGGRSNPSPAQLPPAPWQQAPRPRPPRGSPYFQPRTPSTRLQGSRQRGDLQRGTDGPGGAAPRCAQRGGSAPWPPAAAAPRGGTHPE